MKSSPTLLAFYKWWMESFSEEPKLSLPTPAERCSGLCSNLVLYVYLAKVDAEEFKSIRNEMTEQFKAERLDPLLPFNTTIGHFFMEAENRICHLNPKRVLWVKTRIQDMEERE